MLSALLATSAADRPLRLSDAIMLDMRAVKPDDPFCAAPRYTLSSSFCASMIELSTMHLPRSSKRVCFGIPASSKTRDWSRFGESTSIRNEPLTCSRSMISSSACKVYCGGTRNMHPSPRAIASPSRSTHAASSLCGLAVKIFIPRPSLCPKIVSRETSQPIPRRPQIAAPKCFT